MACPSFTGNCRAGGQPAHTLFARLARTGFFTSFGARKPSGKHGGAATCLLVASQVMRRRSGFMRHRAKHRAKANDAGTDGPKQSRGKAIMQDLWMKARQDIQRRETPGWEAELAARFKASDCSEFEVKEASGVDEVWGASQLLTARDSEDMTSIPADDSDAGDANPFLGLGLMRAYSALSADAPLTAIATSDEGVICMAQVKKDGYVQNLVVKPSSRRKGVASQIICWCATQSRRRGATQLWMHVEPGNEPALNFYRRLGFEVGEEEIYKERRAVRLTKQL